MASDIIIVNHHLFFADLAIREQVEMPIIPEYDAVIFDEAHEIEDVAGQYFGVSVSNHQFTDLRRDIGATARQKNAGSAELDRILELARGDCGPVLRALPGGRRSRRVPRARRVSRAARRRLHDFQRALDLIACQLSADARVPPEEMMLLCARAREYAANLRFWMEDRASHRMSTTSSGAAGAAATCRRRRSTWLRCSKTSSSTRSAPRC